MTTLHFATGEVASMLGVSPHTVRAWERRYLALTPARSPSGQRRYTLDDVAQLRQIKHERHAHHLSLRIATMSVQGIIAVADEEAESKADAPSANTIADPTGIVPNLVSEVVLVLGQEGKVLWANVAFAKFTNRLISQIRGAKFVDFVDLYDRAKAVQAYSQPFRRRRRWELNLSSARRRALFSFDCCPVNSDHGPLLMLVGTEQGGDQADLSEQSSSRGGRIEGRLPTSFAALLAGSADPVRVAGLVARWVEPWSVAVALVSADDSLNIITANQLFKARLSDAHLPVHGRRLTDLLPTDASAAAQSAAERAIRFAEVQLVREWFMSPWIHGPARDLEVLPVTDQKRNVTHLLMCSSPSPWLRNAPTPLEGLATFIQAVRRESNADRVLELACRCGDEVLAGTVTRAARVSNTAPHLHLVRSGEVMASSTEEDRVCSDLLRVTTRSAEPLEISWPSSAGPETMRMEPIIPPTSLPELPTVVGALSFRRPGLEPFSQSERWLAAELADRVAAALDRIAEHQLSARTADRTDGGHVILPVGGHKSPADGRELSRCAAGGTLVADLQDISDGLGSTSRPRSKGAS